MSEIITELYYMVDAWAGQQYERSEEARGLEEKRFALMEEIARRVGEGGMEMVEELSNLWLKLEDIHSEALFRASVHGDGAGAKAGGPLRRGWWTVPACQCPDTGGSTNKGNWGRTHHTPGGHPPGHRGGSPVNRGILKGGPP